MKTIHKYKLLPEKHQFVKIPHGATVLSAGVQNGDVVIWALVDSEQPKEDREFTILATGEYAGQAFMKGSKFIGTVFPIEPLVFHVFETT